jgi:predicted oxidoreductase
MLGTLGKQNPEITGMKYQKIIQQKTKSGYFPITGVIDCSRDFRVRS